MSGGTGYTPMSPKESPMKKDKSQQPDDSDEEDILSSVCPDGLADDSVRTFIFKNQNHTLGNLLRDQILKYPEVHFCGYSQPHPGERVMHLRVQTLPGSGIPAGDMLKKGLKDVIAMCEHVEDLFNEELEKKEWETDSSANP
ncbi:DNA-directed RNA polymerases I and III subunit RPAC2 [Orchesella cincta]|uniref:DNA-directed RNA polymerases I and III subunit RPAC2 n=1 Tax=Orchesella cincta TaxID=48709 RepID=A0A1D2MCX8_ORCCI|nr:DNA-directed RNA polymerases I and III subunit RPAC2 [Orchesella cincta]